MLWAGFLVHTLQKRDNLSTEQLAPVGLFVWRYDGIVWQVWTDVLTPYVASLFLVGYRVVL